MSHLPLPIVDCPKRQAVLVQLHALTQVCNVWWHYPVSVINRHQPRTAKRVASIEAATLEQLELARQCMQNSLQARIARGQVLVPNRLHPTHQVRA